MIDALRVKFDCPPWLEELLRIGYPASPIRLGYRAFFPPLAELIEFREEDPAWPRRWLPIEFSGGHQVLFVRADLPENDGVWEYFREGAEPEDVHTPPKTPKWEDLGVFLSAIQALCVEAKESNFVVAEGMRWLSSDAVARLDEQLGKERARRALGFVGIQTADGVRVHWDTDRRASLFAMMLTGLFTALAGSFVFMPGGRGWVFAVMVGVLPAALLVYSARSWRRSRARLRLLARREEDR